MLCSTDTIESLTARFRRAVNARDPSSVPDPFEDAEHARDWLPLDWHPDRFEVEEVNVTLGSAVAEPVPVAGDLAALADQFARRGNWR